MVPVHLCGAFLWVLFFSHERRVLPRIIFSLSCFLPHYAHNKGHEAHRHTHKFIKSQETRLIWLTARVSSLSRVCNLASPTDLAAIMHRIFQSEGRTRIKEQESARVNFRILSVMFQTSISPGTTFKLYSFLVKLKDVISSYQMISFRHN